MFNTFLKIFTRFFIVKNKKELATEYKFAIPLWTPTLKFYYPDQSLDKLFYQNFRKKYFSQGNSTDTLSIQERKKNIEKEYVRHLAEIFRVVIDQMVKGIKKQLIFRFLASYIIPAAMILYKWIQISEPISLIHFILHHLSSIQKISLLISLFIVPCIGVWITIQGNQFMKKMLVSYLYLEETLETPFLKTEAAFLFSCGEGMDEKIIEKIEKTFMLAYSDPNNIQIIEIDEQVNQIMRFATPPQFKEIAYTDKMKKEIDQLFQLYNTETQEGLHKIKEMVLFKAKELGGKQKTSLANHETVSYLVVAPPGSGKSGTLAELVKILTGFMPMQVNLNERPEEVYGTVDKLGKLASAKINQPHKPNAELVVLLDDGDTALNKKKNNLDLDLLDPAKPTYRSDFLNLSIQKPPIIIVTGNEPIQEEALKRRFFALIEWQKHPYNEKGYVETFLQIIRKKLDDNNHTPLKKEEEKALHKLANDCFDQGKNVADLHKEALRFVMNR